MARSAFEIALQAGLKASRQFAGVPITYTRGPTTITIDSAIEGTLRYGTLSHSGQDLIVELTDWMIDKNQMTLGDPEIGDSIRRTVDGVLSIFFVEQMEMGLHHWDWCDTGRTQYRIRTRKLTTTVSEPRGYDIRGQEIKYD